MKRILAILVPIALAACQTVPTEQVTPPPPLVVKDKADDTASPAPEKKADETVKAEDAVSKTDAEPKKETTENKEDAAKQADKKTVVMVRRGYVAFEKSELVVSLISESLLQDDVALMGVVSGARLYCKLKWEPGFVTFLNAANQQGLDLEKVADNHGYYLGASYRSLTQAKYACTEDDLIELRAVDPY